MKGRNGSTFTAECHVRYLREIHLGDPVQVWVWLLEADDKRLHTFEEMRHATEGWLSATSEKHVAAHGHERRAQGGAVSARQPRERIQRLSLPRLIVTRRTSSTRGGSRLTPTRDGR